MIAAPTGNPPASVISKLFELGPLPAGGPVTVQPPVSVPSNEVDPPGHRYWERGDHSPQAYGKAYRDHDGIIWDTAIATLIRMQKAAGTKLLRRGATAAVCASDVFALGVIRGIHREGPRVPEDFSVVGFDDSMLMACTDPPLTTVRQPIESMGRSAVTTLLSLVGGEQVSSEELLFAPELVVRASTGAASAARRPLVEAASG